MVKTSEPIENEEKRNNTLKGLVKFVKRPGGSYTARKTQETSTRNKAKRKAKKKEVLP
jgi:hypothetical protein